VRVVDAPWRENRTQESVRGPPDNRLVYLDDIQDITKQEDKKMRNYILAMLAIGFFSIAGCAPKNNPDAEKAAAESAQAWLELVDSEKYAESWEEAAEYFKSVISKDKWEGTIQAVRKPLGKTISRELKSRRYRTSLPGAPDGEYVVIQYKTSFENKKSAIETITPMLDKDGKWRVSGYYIK